MISAVRVGNFKAFGDTQCVPIKPLTFLYGPNSGGKSSVIHGLVLAAHGQHTGDLEGPASWCGGKVDLGGYKQYVHRGDLSRRVEIALEFSVQPEGEWELSSLELAAAPELLADVVRVCVRLVIGPSGLAGAGRVERFGVELDGMPLAGMALESDVLGTRPLFRLDSLNGRHPVLLRAVQQQRAGGAPRSPRPRASAGAVQAATALLGRLTADVRGILPAGIRERAGADLCAGSGAGGKGRRGGTDWGLAVVRSLDDLVRDLTAATKWELGGLQYIGPLRPYPPRDHRAAPPAAVRGAESDRLFHWHGWREDDNRFSRIGRWLSEPSRLSTTYEFDYESPEWLLGTLRRAVEARRTEGGKGVAEGLMAYIGGSVAPEELHLTITDCRSGARVGLQDIGAGISQVVPVLDLAFGYGGFVIAIEQPEVHLHPALQAELADVFAESALGGMGLRRRFILETHSEHLLLRIMKRMRQTANGTLPEGFPPVRPADVAVLYVEPQGTQSVVYELQLDEDGSLLDPWPGGFFEEGFRERFDL